MAKQGHDSTNWENSLEERKRQTRPMTSLEFAKYVAENFGKLVWRIKDWPEGAWSSYIAIFNNEDPERVQQSRIPESGLESDLVWSEIPEVEV